MTTALLTLTILTTYATDSASESQEITAELKKLQGTWLIVSDIYEGEASDNEANWQLDIAGCKILMTSEKGHAFCGVLTLNTSTSPRQIDVVWEDSGGVVEKGIYALEEGRLTLCYSGIDCERPNSFASQAGDETTLLVTRRVEMERRNPIAELVHKGARVHFSDDNDRCYVVLAGKPFGDASLARLRKVRVASLTLNDTLVTDAGVRQLMAWKWLHEVSVLNQTLITDAGFADLAKATRLSVRRDARFHDRCELKLFAISYLEFCDFRHAAPVHWREFKAALPAELTGHDSWVRNRIQAGELIVGWGEMPPAGIEQRSEFVLAYEKTVPQRGGLVVLADGQVVDQTAEEFQRMTRASK